MATDIQNQYRDFNLIYTAGGTNGSAAVTGYMSVRESLLNILFTDLGSRFFNRRFGCLLQPLLFEPMNDNTVANIRNILYIDIPELEPRIEIGPFDIDIESDYSNHCYIVTLHAIEKSTNQAFKLSAVLEQVL